MGFFATFFAVLGASCVAWLLMKFIVWIDGADLIDAEEEATVMGRAPGATEHHIDLRDAA